MLREQAYFVRTIVKVVWGLSTIWCTLGVEVEIHTFVFSSKKRGNKIQLYFSFLAGIVFCFLYEFQKLQLSDNAPQGAGGGGCI